jgi:hypothetical protein
VAFLRFFASARCRNIYEVFRCHPERSEGSDVFEKTRFFASLRLTIKVKRFMTHHTSVAILSEVFYGRLNMVSALG